jgi:RHS repeat-associated protein
VRPWGQEPTGAPTPFSWLGSHGYWYEGQLARPMHYVRARWYVTTGYYEFGSEGWLSPDPLGFGGGDWNLHRYVGNRPTVGVDPSGKKACQSVGEALAGFKNLIPADDCGSACNPLTGRAFTVCGDATDEIPCCSCQCTEAHEAQHRMDYEMFGCCQRANACWADRGNNLQDCNDALLKWEADILSWTECKAFSVQYQCLLKQFQDNRCDQSNTVCDFPKLGSPALLMNPLPQRARRSRLGKCRSRPCGAWDRVAPRLQRRRSDVSGSSAFTKSAGEPKLALPHFW